MSMASAISTSLCCKKAAPSILDDIHERADGTTDGNETGKLLGRRR
ncbi:MAG: hypothetical protein KC731_23495 [Myxococcales bacterium]|nr:hypothetical protein [Myxococcales bacterium]